jgi:hypothetical protein
MHHILQLLAIFGLVFAFVASKPNPPTQFNAVLAVTSSLGDTRYQFYYDLAQFAERSENKMAGYLQITVVRYDQHKAYVWFDGSQQCQMIAINNNSNPNIWSWLSNAQDQGRTTFDGRACSLWQSQDPDSAATLLGCFADDSSPVFMNVSYPNLHPLRIAFYNLRVGRQQASLFQPPSFCIRAPHTKSPNKKFAVSHFWTDLFNRSIKP